ncbi:MAG: hypothetical protein LBT38_09835 [Deltaproteobacteria bacterium]|nr:hypothetical protein [Deltaproteobacteria bacterium]
MKLGTKIILGYVSTCVLFSLISVVVVFSLLSVQSDSAELRDKIIPLNDQGGYQLTNALHAQEALVEYSYNANQEALDRYRKFDAETVKSHQAIEAIFRQGLSSNIALAKDLTTQAIKDYAAFQVQANKAPILMKTIVDNRATMLATYQELNEGLTNFRNQRQAQLNRVITATNGGTIDMEEYQRVNNLLTHAYKMRDLSINYYINFLRGLYYQEAKYFQSSVDDVTKIGVELNELVNDPRITESRAQILELMDLATTAQTSVKILFQAMTTYMDERQAFITSADQAMATGLKLSDAMTGLTNEFVVETNVSLNSAFWTVVIGGILALVISAILSIVITRNITLPLNRVIGALSDGAQEVIALPGISLPPPIPWPREPRKTPPLWKKPARLWKSFLP